MLYHRERGVTLIMVAGVLAVLAALGTGFYTVMVMQTKSAMRYSDAVRAEMLARAGIEFSIAQLRDQAFKKTEEPSSPWFMTDYLNGGKRNISFPDSPLLRDKVDDDSDGVADNLEEARSDMTKIKGYSVALGNSAGPDSDRVSVSVFDAASRININACDNLAGVLDNLCRVIGPPLVSADQDAIQPRVWAVLGATAGMFDIAGKNDDDKTPDASKPALYRNIYFWLYNAGGTATWRNLYAPGTGTPDPLGGRPRLRTDGSARAMYGDGYAIAGHRARYGKFKSLEEVKSALTYVERNGNDRADEQLELLEIEVKYAALRDYITIDSWVDTNSVCVGKFEWVVQSGASGGDPYTIGIDRDKSWIPDDPVNDPLNKRGSLRGCYLSIINGHGAGQLRRIRTNGVDWVELETFLDPVTGAKLGFTIPPGPISSYMIVAPEDAKLVDVNGSDLPYSYANNMPPAGTTTFPKTNADGTLVDDPNIDYAARPLCIHRAPVNINTASEKVLAALFMGINVSHGNFMSVGTDSDIRRLAMDPATGRPLSRYKWNPTKPDWIITDFDDTTQIYRTVEPYVLTPKGMKRIPADTGKVVLDRPKPWDAPVVAPGANENAKYDYIRNYGYLDAPDFVIRNDKDGAPGKLNAAHELAYRVLVARQVDTADPARASHKWIDPKTGNSSAVQLDSYARGAFKNWDDFYFRVVRPWDDQRLDPASPVYDPRAGSVARVIMAHFNSNTDILKFNPNIEWIDRWGRNFTEMEPVMVYTNDPETIDGMSLGGHGNVNGSGSVNTCDLEGVFDMSKAMPVFSRERLGWNGGSPWFVCGIFGTDPKWMGSYVTRSFRYKADEMIDKTDLNRSTTEFAFDSKGIFEIQSTGQVTRRGEVMAERKVQALIQVYDVWSETTQRQFVQGHISRAVGAPGTPQSGQVARDATNVKDRLALTTLPEPLVPLGYRIVNPNNKEVVDTDAPALAVNQKRNAWGQAVDISLPAVLANKVLPAGYDGQIILATNTLRFDPARSATAPNGDMDSFLASFNGDMDTETCNGNGHEQAKTPANCKIPVLDAIGLLGALNDNQIDSDPGIYGSPSMQGAGQYVKKDMIPPWGDNTNYSNPSTEIYRYQSVRNALRGLRPVMANGDIAYWNNITCRQGDLRPDGLYVGGPGVSGNDGVMKFLSGADGASAGAQVSNSDFDSQNFSLNGRGAIKAVGEDRNNAGTCGTQEGWLLSMWTKTTWHHDDHRSHEFFDASMPGWNDSGIRCEAFWLRKQGGPQWAVCESGAIPNGMQPYEDGTWGVSGAGNRVNDLSLIGEHIQDGGDWSEPDWCMYLHGGQSGVVPERTDKTRFPGTYKPESPAYRVQPFRWHFVGARIFLQPNFATATNGAPGLTDPGGASKSGYLKWNTNPTNSVWSTQNCFRPFIDSERWSDGLNYKYTYNNQNIKYWCVQQRQGAAGFSLFQSKGREGPVAGRANGGQPVRYCWAHPGGWGSLDGKGITNHPIIGLNNCNPGRGYPPGGAGDFTSIYRGTPEEGTFAVIDEYKISRKETVLRTWSNSTDPSTADWARDRIARNDASKPGEMTLSRYYLPVNPTVAMECPTFTSQTMLQSLKGYDKKTAPLPEMVTVARVSWNVFTPRFLHENKSWNQGGPAFFHNETITTGSGWQGGGTFVQVTNTVPVPFRGPFDYCVYNDKAAAGNGRNPNGPFKAASAIDGRVLKAEEREDYNDPLYDAEMTIVPYRCNRPTPAQYQTVAPYANDKNYHATKGVEVELLQDNDEYADNGGGSIIAGPFTNPDVVNKVLGAAGELGRRVPTDRLRYRVRFRYPVDTLADAASPAKPWVDPATQFLLDTPVFDDISITYFSKPRILDYKEVNE